MYCPIIKVENVSKIFRIYDRPSDRLKEVFSLRRSKYHTDYPALNEISFEVKKGEFLGVVGRNGAGKSTLLKILSRELTPTTGNVTINGKVSLLQLGVGFDPELTGIENARFASKLLGYSDKAIRKILEDIVDFADIGEFINHPVKTYSSGMYSRLSFAVGINIDPDILIADEVLSVGDMRFSQKCLRKMREFKEQGKTVIFVSHDIQSVNAFCDTVMWIKDGISFMHGEAKQVTTHFQNYMLYEKLPSDKDGTGSKVQTKKNDLNHDVTDSKMAASTEIPNKGIEWIDIENFSSIGNRRAEIRRICFLSMLSNSSLKNIQGNEEVELLLDILVKEEIENFQIGMTISNQKGLIAMHTNNEICGFPNPTIHKCDSIISRFKFKLPSIASGNYMLSVGLQSGLEMIQLVNDVFEFVVARTDIVGSQCGYVIIENEEFKFLN